MGRELYYKKLQLIGKNHIRNVKKIALFIFYFLFLLLNSKEASSLDELLQFHQYPKILIM